MYDTLRELAGRYLPPEILDILGLNPNGPTHIEEDFLSGIPGGATRIARDFYRVPGDGTYQNFGGGRVRFFHDEKTGRYLPLQRIVAEKPTEPPNVPRREPTADIGLVVESGARA